MSGLKPRTGRVRSLKQKEKGIHAFLELDREKWKCPECGGAFSLHDGVCSKCQGGIV